jgi:Glycosyl transferases group 1
LEAFALVLRNLPGARLTLVGGGEVPQQVSELQHLTQRMGRERQVTFLGPQPHTAVARIMREEADLLVLSSQAETFGCVLIEALACGKPVVSTRSGGPEDIITADFLGELCVNGSPEALAQAIVGQPFSRVLWGVLYLELWYRQFKVVAYLPEYAFTTYSAAYRRAFQLSISKLDWRTI